MARFFAKDPSPYPRLRFRATKTLCIPALLDLIYLASTAASVFGYRLHAVTLIGAAGIVVNFAKGYILSVSEKKAFPFWWLAPCLVLPWSTFYALNKGLWPRREHPYPAKDRFRISTTVAGVVLLVALLAGNIAGPLNNYADKTLSPLEKSGQSYLLETSKQVGIAFATARLLNGMLSMIEELEVSAKLGVGASLSPGENPGAPGRPGRAFLHCHADQFRYGKRPPSLGDNRKNNRAHSDCPLGGFPVHSLLVGFEERQNSNGCCRIQNDCARAVSLYSGSGSRSGQLPRGPDYSQGRTSPGPAKNA